MLYIAIDISSSCRAEDIERGLDRVRHAFLCCDEAVIHLVADKLITSTILKKPTVTDIVDFACLSMPFQRGGATFECVFQYLTENWKMSSELVQNKLDALILVSDGWINMEKLWYLYPVCKEFPILLSFTDPTCPDPLAPYENIELVT